MFELNSKQSVNQFVKTTANIPTVENSIKLLKRSMKRFFHFKFKKKQDLNFKIFYLIHTQELSIQNWRQISWQFTVLLCKLDLSKVKWNLTFSTINFVHYLPHDLQNDLRLRILGNQEMERSINQSRIQAGAQAPFQKLVIGNSSQNLRENVFGSRPDLLDFLTFCQIFCH